MISDIDLDSNGTYIEITPVEENTGKSISIHTLDNCKVLNITSNNRVLQLLSDYNEGKIYEIDGNFVVMEDELKVPNFITKSEFKEQKEAKTYKKTK